MAHTRKVVACVGAIAMSVSVGCRKKPNEKPTSAAGGPDVPRVAGLESTSDDRELINEVADLYRKLFNVDYVMKLSDMDANKVGAVDDSRTPFSGHWFPESRGGTNVGAPNEPTALEKFDKAFNSASPLAVNWEKQNHSDQESWYGHCNGFAVSASRFQDPKKHVGRPEGCEQATPPNCVVFFEPHDIRALLAEVSMNAKSRFISGDRCRLRKDQLSTAPQERANPTVMDECDDLNPGSFHIALVNFIGKQKQPLIFDYNRDYEVWNYPVYRYTTAIDNGGKRLTRAEATAVTARPGAQDYEFNKAARSFVTVTTTITYANAKNEQVFGPAPPDGKPYTYNYILELDENENIIGGEWLAESRVNHPDFLWIPFETFDPTGSRKYGNPHVSPREVVRLWADAMGFNRDDPFKDPTNPNKVLFAPEGDKAWGKHDHFSLVLDGKTTGAVFLGKKTVMDVKRNVRLQGDVVLKVTLNGQALADSPGAGTDDIKVTFDATPGINTLDFAWRQKAATATELSASFLFYGMR